jgi:excisionase family DNA binding protein
MPKTPLPPLPDLLTPTEAADVFRVTTRTLARWAQAGKLDVVRTPLGRRRYKRDDVQRLLTDGGAS